MTNILMSNIAALPHRSALGASGHGPSWTSEQSSIHARGPVSEALLEAFARPPHSITRRVLPAIHAFSETDEALALYLCYELAYQGLPGCDPEWEWEPSVIALRTLLEHRFLESLREAVPSRPRDKTACEFIGQLAKDDSPSLSTYLAENGTIEEFREFAIHRSAYQLKEADPHTWAIPRLRGRAKAALVAIQYEEYGEAVAGEMHAELFATTMRVLGLDQTYGAYIDVLPAITLQTVNLVTLFGLHRRWRGALVGHLTLFEMTSTAPNARYAQALRRLGVAESAIRFFDAHVIADATHEVLAQERLLGGLLDDDPSLADDAAFGAACLTHLDRRFAHHLLTSWRERRSSLLERDSRAEGISLS